MKMGAFGLTRSAVRVSPANPKAKGSFHTRIGNVLTAGRQVTLQHIVLRRGKVRVVSRVAVVSLEARVANLVREENLAKVSKTTDDEPKTDCAPGPRSTRASTVPQLR